MNESVYYNVDSIADKAHFFPEHGEINFPPNHQGKQGQKNVSNRSHIEPPFDLWLYVTISAVQYSGLCTPPEIISDFWMKFSALYCLLDSTSSIMESHNNRREGTR